MKITRNNISENETEIICEILAEEFEKERPHALKRIGAEVSLPGFRKGHVPDHVLAQKFGEAFILEEMANLAMERAYPEILREHRIAAIAQPTAQVKKLAKGNPFEFSLTFQVLPEIILPDYKKIAQEVMGGVEDTSATDEEVSRAKDDLLKQFATKDAHGHGGHGGAGQAAGQAEGKEMLPELTLELAQKFGPFATIEEFLAKIKESIIHEKALRAKEKKRMQAMEKIAENITAKIPTVLIEGELDRMTSRFRHDVEHMGMNPVRGRDGTQRASTSNGMKFDEYLKTIKKTEEDFRKEWRTDAEKSAKIQIAIGKIASTEKLEVPKDELDREVKFFTEQYKDVEPARAYTYLEMMLTNEKVFQFLEAQK